MINDSKVQINIHKIKQDLIILREGKTRSGRRVPNAIRDEIIKLHKSGWSVSQIEKEFQLASSAIYRWLEGSKKSVLKDETKQETQDHISEVQNKVTVQKIKKPRQLKIIEDMNVPKTESSIFENLIQLELRSGVKLNIPQKQLSFELLKSLNSL